MEIMDVFDSYSERYRRQYNIVKEFLAEELSVCALIGPRKVGKTFLLGQLASEYSNAIYVDFKIVSDPDAQDEIFSNIVESIEKRQNVIWLLDEITSCDLFDNKLCMLAEKLVRISPVKIIITGSQQTAIKASMYSAFSIKAKYIYMPFLSFYEYIMMNKFSSEYHKISLDNILQFDITEEDFKNYVTQKYSLMKYTDLEAYVTACLNETITSNLKSCSCLVNDVTDVDVTDIIKVMYAILYKLHNRCNTTTFIADDHVKKITSDYNFKYTKIRRVDLLEAYQKSIFYKYQSAKMVDKETFRKIILFLKEINFIYVETDNLQDIANWSKYKCHSDNALNVDEFFSRYNVCFKYPFFYYALVEDIVKNLNDTITASDFLFGSLYGSMVECAVKGALANFERDDILLILRDDCHEVDFFSGTRQIAVEISVRDKGLVETNFDHFSELLSASQKFLLGRDKFELGDIIRIPYYLFIMYIESL